jgi:CDP-glucose 4,6-dehydratase
VLPNPSFWRGRRVFLTGHTGFKGAWLSLWLHQLGAEVTGFSRGLLGERSLFEEAGLSDTLKDGRGDVRDATSVARALTEAEPDIVLHLAAQSLVRYSYAEPVETYATNVMGTVHVLDAVRRLARPCVAVMVTSDKCYENREWVWGYRENEPMGGHDPYSSSKGCAELVTSAYARSYMSDTEHRAVSARAGNVIGGGDWGQDRLVPDLARGLISGHSIPIRNPDAIRPWQHVLEPLCGYLLLAEAVTADPAKAHEGWNFGPGPESEVPARRIADQICERWGTPTGWHYAGQPGQQHEAQILRLDSTKARSRLGWRPRWGLDRALDACVEIYRSGLTGPGLRDLVSRQIAEYAATPD